VHLGCGLRGPSRRPGTDVAYLAPVLLRTFGRLPELPALHIEPPANQRIHGSEVKLGAGPGLPHPSLDCDLQGVASENVRLKTFSGGDDRPRQHQSRVHG